ncbi:MAG: L-2-hydroxyglutarate oxidase [Calditrichaeota bacterium]|nr:MAG: L-2-hydroxyglutarate oxidase [Calditrichota bacterium]
METEKTFDVVIIGAGIVGLATAYQLSKERRLKLLVVETEKEIARHQTGHNSGVIHSGLYYKPGSLKAKNCVRGRESMYIFCENNEIPHERCGKLVVATNASESARLKALFHRGQKNGLMGLKMLSADAMREYEPHVRGTAALYVPETGIVDYKDVAKAYLWHMRKRGVEVKLGARFTGLQHGKDNRYTVETTDGAWHTRNIINCGGLYSDRIAKLCGLHPGVRIVPFRGEYYELKPDRHHLVRNLIYPVPNPRFPFLGVHFTRMIKGGVEAGPNAVLAFKREGYNKTDFDWRDTLDIFGYTGFWVLAAKYGLYGLGEFYRSWSKKAFVRALRKLIPEITEEDLKTGGAGVRAQALSPTGKLIDDFYFAEAPGQIHVLNAPSPAATASLSIGRTIADKALARFEF